MYIVDRHEISNPYRFTIPKYKLFYLCFRSYCTSDLFCFFLSEKLSQNQANRKVYKFENEQSDRYSFMIFTSLIKLLYEPKNNQLFLFTMLVKLLHILNNLVTYFPRSFRCILSFKIYSFLMIGYILNLKIWFLLIVISKFYRKYILSWSFERLDSLYDNFLIIVITK